MASTTTAPTSREFDLLMACCACAFDAGRIGPVQAILNGCDLGEVALLSRRHRVEALVWSALTAAGATIAEPVHQSLHEQAEARIVQNLQSTIALERLARDAADQGLEFLLIKGLATGQLAYRNPMERTGRDIDILVAAEDIGSASEMLSRAGFTASLPTHGHVRWHHNHKESVWVGPQGLILELHSALTDNDGLIPAIGMASPRQIVRIGGASVPTLAPSELIAYTAAHGSWSMWFRAKWIVDLAALLWARHGEDVADASLEECWSLGGGRSASLGFVLAHQLLGTRLSEATLVRLQNDQVTIRLARRAMRIMTAEEPTLRRFGTLGLRWNQLALLPDTAAALREAGRQTREMIGNQLVRLNQ